MLPGVFGSIPCLQSFCKQERNTLVYQSIFGPVFMRNSNAGDCSLTSGHTGTSVWGSSKVNGTLVRFSATILSQNKREIVEYLMIFSVVIFIFKNSSIACVLTSISAETSTVSSTEVVECYQRVWVRFSAFSLCSGASPPGWVGIRSYPNLTGGLA